LNEHDEIQMDENTTPETTNPDSPEASLSADLTLGSAAAATPEAVESETKTKTRRQINYIHGEAAKKYGWWWGTGRRKTAVARVRIRPGSGEFKINKRSVESYFTEPRDRANAEAALQATKTLGKMDVQVNVKGGGYAGQAGAVLLGVARALRTYDCAHEDVLRDHGYLTRDSRRVERKKYGQRGARRRFQFSKR